LLPQYSIYASNTSKQSVLHVRNTIDDRVVGSPPVSTAILEFCEVEASIERQSKVPMCFFEKIWLSISAFPIDSYLSVCSFADAGEDGASAPASMVHCEKSGRKLEG
jgi:hypothetical protein